MADISRGGYYKQKNRTENPQLNSYQKSDEEVKKAILEIYQGLFRTYGKRKMKIVLQVRYGLQVSVRRVARLMRELNLKPNTTRAKRKSNTAILKKSSKRIDYLVRNFNADSVNKKWVTDISYVPLSNSNQKLYFTSIIDLRSRKVLAWKICDNQTVDIVTNLLTEAVKLYKSSKGLIVHSDQGTQYTGYEVEALMEKYGFTHSFSRPGCPQDNAVIESFHSLLKVEHLRYIELVDIDHAREEISTYITWYNNERIHETLGYMTPSKVHEMTTQEAKNRDKSSEQ